MITIDAERSINNMCIKRFIAVILTIMILLTGCGSRAKEVSLITSTMTPSETTPPPAPTLVPISKERYNPSQQLIGLVIDKSNGIMSLAAVHGFLRTAEIMGYPAKLYDANTASEAVSNVDKAVSEGCTGLIIWASTPELKEAAKKAKQEGIHVVVPYYTIDPSYVDANLAPDPNDYAFEAARIMCEQIKLRPRNKGTIVIIGSQQYPEISDAFEKAITEQFSSYTIDKVGDDADVNAYVSKHKDLVGVLALKPDSAKTWINAYKAVLGTQSPKPAQSDKPKKSTTPTPQPTKDPNGRIKPVIIALDYTENNLALVKDGTIFAIIARPYYDSTAQSMAVIDRLLRGIPTQTQVRLNAPIIRSANVDKYISIMKEINEWFNLK